MAVLPLFALLGLVETGDAILLGAICWLLNLWLEIFAKERFYLLAIAIYGQYLTNTGYGYCHEVRHRLLARGEGHRMGEDVALDEEVFAIYCL